MKKYKRFVDRSQKQNYCNFPKGLFSYENMKIDDKFKLIFTHEDFKEIPYHIQINKNRRPKNP